MEFIKLVAVERRLAERLDALRLHQLLRGRAVQRARDRCSGPRPTACAASTITPGEPEEPAGRRQERGPGQRAEPAVRRLPVARPAAEREHELVQRAQLLRRPRRTSTRRRSRTSQKFFKTYYAPNNAVLVVAGDFDPGAGEGLDREVLRRHPVGAAAAARPTSPSRRRTEEKRADRDRPARARAGARASATTCRRATRPSTTRWACSTRSSSRARTAGCTRRWCRSAGLTGEVATAASTWPRQHVRLQRADAVDGVAVPRRGQDRRRRSSPRSTPAIEPLRQAPVDAATLERARVKARCAYYADIGAALRLRPRRPARACAPLRRRPGGGQPHRAELRSRSRRSSFRRRRRSGCVPPTAPWSPCNRWEASDVAHRARTRAARHRPRVRGSRGAARPRPHPALRAADDHRLHPEERAQGHARPLRGHSQDPRGARTAPGQRRRGGPPDRTRGFAWGKLLLQGTTTKSAVQLAEAAAGLRRSAGGQRPRGRHRAGD